MEDYETNILFEHTKRLREGRLLLEQQEDGRQSESSGSSDAMSESQTPWFQRCWSVQPGKVDTSQAAGSKRPPLQPTTVVTEMHGGSIAPTDNENVQPFSRHKVRSWRQNFDIATSNPTLKRVVHATYGNLLEGKNCKDSNTPGFMAVPQMYKLQGDALYHIL
jgi:hypothetical protein